MRTIKNLEVPQNSNAKFPFSTIQNETDTQNGTPVVEEIYGDIITNIYKLLQQVGITPTETQDSDTSQYQILQALQQLPNSLNDIERVLSLDGTTWNIDLNIDLLPNKYFFIARASEDYVSGISYGFKSSIVGVSAYSFFSNGFKAGDELLIIIDNSQVRAYSLSAFYGAKEEVFSVLGEPLSFNNSDKMYYQHEGKLFSDDPNIYDLQQRIRDEISASTAVVVDMVIINGYVLCFCFDEPTLLYFFVQFALTDLNTPIAINVDGASWGNTVDYMPYIYAYKEGVYVSNRMNNDITDNKLSQLYYDPLTATMINVSDIYLDDSGFTKTTNTVIKEHIMYTFILDELKIYNLDSGNLESVTTFPSFVGRLIIFKNEIYFLNGEVAKKWNL